MASENERSGIAERVDLITNLFDAVSQGNLSVVQAILENDFSIQAFRNLSPTLLHQAANNKHKLVLEYLVDMGAYIDSRNAQQMTALHVSANKGDTDSVSILLKKGADINVTDYDNRTPLYFAAYDGYDDCINALLKEEKLDQKIARNGGWTPLHEAARFGHLHCVKALLLAGANIYARTEDAWWTPGHMAASCGKIDCLKALIDAGIDVNAGAGPYKTSTLLHEAAHQGHHKCVKLLLDSGADPCCYSSNNLPHHLASRHGHAEVLDVILEYFKDKKKNHYIDAFIDVDPRANSLTYQNATHVAALYGRYKCLEVLLKHGAKHLPNGTKMYPVMLAACKMHLQCMRLLLSDMKEKMKTNQFDFLQSDGHYNALHHLAMKTYKTTEKTISCACVLLNSGIIDVNHYDSEWDVSTCLYTAARNGAIGLVQYLLLSGANPYLCDNLKMFLLNNPNTQYCSDLIDDAKSEAKSLILQCRLYIRKKLKSNMEQCFDLPIPRSLKNYLYHGHQVRDKSCSP